MRPSEIAAATRRTVARIVPARVQTAGARALGAVHAPRWARPDWELVPRGWEKADEPGSLPDWDDQAVADGYRVKRREVLEALRTGEPLAFPTSALRPTAERTVRDHNTTMCFAYALAHAARGRSRLSVLDWGGGIGLHYHLGKALEPELELDYHVKEVAQVCAVGRELEPAVTFHEGDGCLEQRYDLVMASSALQYEEAWKETLERMARAASAYLFLTRVPVVFRASSYVVRHRASMRGVPADFLSWVVNRDELVACAERGDVVLEREFLIMPSPLIVGAPERQEVRAFLFRAGSERQVATV